MDQISGRLNNYSTMSLGLRNGIRSRITKHGGKRVENKTNENLDDEEEFMDIGDDSSFDSNVSVGGKTEIKDRRGVKRKSCVDTAVFEEQLNQLQEQLVSAMIENQALSQQLEKYKAAAKRESVTETNDGQFQKTLRNYRARSWEKRQGTRKEILPVSEPVQETEVEGSETDMKRTSWDSFRDRLVEYLYEIVDDFTEITKPEQPQVEPEPQLAVKTLKANIKRFMTAIKPYTDTFKGLRNLVTWRSPSYTLIVLCIFTYTVIKGWFLQFLVFLAILRITVNYLHFKNFNFKFSYLDPGEPEKDRENQGLFWKGLINTLPHDKILDWCKVEAFVDKKINAVKLREFVYERVENIVGKIESAGPEFGIWEPVSTLGLSIGLHIWYKYWYM